MLVLIAPGVRVVDGVGATAGGATVSVRLVEVVEAVVEVEVEVAEVVVLVVPTDVVEEEVVVEVVAALADVLEALTAEGDKNMD